MKQNIFSMQQIDQRKRILTEKGTYLILPQPALQPPGLRHYPEIAECFSAPQFSGAEKAFG